MKAFSILSVSILISLLGCTPASDESKLAVFHGFEKDDVKTWDPANAYDTVSLDLVPSIYETLYQYSYLSEDYRVEPLLASGPLQISRDRLTVTIPIKKGVFFHDDPCFKATRGKGRELKAQDFVYGLKRLALPSLQSTGWWILDGKVKGINDFHEKLLKATNPQSLKQIFSEDIEGIQALDDSTLQIKLVAPYPVLKYILTMSFTAPVPHEAVEAYGDEKGNLLDHPVGTGPFYLKSWRRNHEIVLDRNPTFHEDFYPAAGSAIFYKDGMLEDAKKRLPFLDRISVQVIKEDQPRWLNFIKGNIDTILLPKDNFKEAIINQVNLAPDLVRQGIRLGIDTGVVIRYLSFNMKDPVLGKNKYLRQAISSAIDREKWINYFTNGTGKKMVNLIPPGIPDRAKTKSIKYDYNLARAKDLLKKAGFPGGEGLPTIKFDLRGASTTDRQLGDFISQQLAAIGVKIDVITNTFPAFLAKWKQGDLQMSYGSWAMDFPDVENILQLLYGPNHSPGPGDSNYQNPDFDRLYEQMAIAELGPKRAALVQKMDDFIQEDVPWALGYYEADYNLSHAWVMNYRGSQIILNKYKYYHVNKETKKRYLQ